MWLWTIGRNCAIFRLSRVAASPAVLLWLALCCWGAFFFRLNSTHEEHRWISQRWVVWGCFALLSVQLREGAAFRLLTATALILSSSLIKFILFPSVKLEVRTGACLSRARPRACAPCDLEPSGI